MGGQERMLEVHSEPYVYLPALSHDTALVAWGAFSFRVRQRGAFKLVEDTTLGPRRDTIGARSVPYGPARVDLFDSRGQLVSSTVTEEANHCWLRGLTPDTEYTYAVRVNDQPWAAETRWDWSAVDGTLRQIGERYSHTFRTFPDPQRPSGRFSFAVVGDIGVGMKRVARERQQESVGIALRRAVEREGVRFILTTGDNIYTRRRDVAAPVPPADDHDGDWFFTYYQPYRYILDRVPVFPAIGTHDASEGEERDDREQVEENFYVHERMVGRGDVTAASVGPGLFYRLRFGSDVEFLCLDTSREEFFAGHRLFDFPEHRQFVEASLTVRRARPRWRIPFAHHPPYSAGPTYYNTREMAGLVALFERAGVRAMFAGHEHNFQHSVTPAIDYFVSGAAGKCRELTPDRLADARTDSWSTACHFLLVTIDGGCMTVRAIAGAAAPHLPLQDIERYGVDGRPRQGPIEVRLPRDQKAVPFSGPARAGLPPPPPAPTARRPRRPGRLR